MDEKVLVVAAHPDDEILGCGATAARHVELEDEVTFVILGEGITSRDTRRDRQSRSPELVSLQSQAREAAAIVGVRSVLTFELPDNRFDSVPLLDVIKIVESVKNKTQPTIVYTHHPGDLNIDHRVTYDAVLTACRPQPGECVKSIYSFEVPSSTEWQGANAAMPFIPNRFVDVEKYLEKKIQAIAAYTSEVREYPHPRSAEALRAIAKRWGSACGLRAAEAFAVVREIR